MDCYQFCYHPQSKKPRKSLIYKAFSILAERASASVELSWNFRLFQFAKNSALSLGELIEKCFQLIASRIIQLHILWLVGW